jgi:hypothetical protein
VTNHKAIADHIALGWSPAQIAAELAAPSSDVDQCVADLQTILHAPTLDAVRERLVQMGYGAAPLAPWNAASFTAGTRSTRVAPAA